VTSNTTTETKRQRGRKVAAILAGGLVLGVGTMATLASWNDSEFAKATFKAGTFNLEGAVDSLQTNFSEHASAGAAGTLQFSAIYNNLQPGDTVYAPYALRLDKFTTYDGTVAVTSDSMTGSSSGISYTLFTTATPGCSSSSVPTGTIVPANTALNSVGAATQINLSKSTNVGTAAGTAVYLCFKVSAATTGTVMTQGQTVAPTWNFTATSGAS
jgi:predicted ribosomally synthesized peptide with SipW-like signal peptide